MTSYPLRHVAIAALVLFGGALLPRAATAQSDPPPEQATSDSSEWYFGGLSLGVGAPAGAYIGFGFAQAPELLEGHFVVAEFGRYATRVSYGYGQHLIEGPGMHGRISVFRTYDDPWRAAPNRTFIGPELRLSASVLVVGFGAYWPTAERAGNRRVFTAFTFSMFL